MKGKEIGELAVCMAPVLRAEGVSASGYQQSWQTHSDPGAEFPAPATLVRRPLISFISDTLKLCAEYTNEAKQKSWSFSKDHHYTIDSWKRLMNDDESKSAEQYRCIQSYSFLCLQTHLGLPA